MKGVNYPVSKNGYNKCEGKNLPYTRENPKQSTKDVRTVNPPMASHVPKVRMGGPKSPLGLK